MQADGIVLVDSCLSTLNSLIQINLFLSDNDRSEYICLGNLIKRMFGLIRNPTANNPLIKLKFEKKKRLIF